MVRNRRRRPIQRRPAERTFPRLSSKPRGMSAICRCSSWGRGVRRPGPKRAMAKNGALAPAIPRRPRSSPPPPTVKQHHQDRKHRDRALGQHGERPQGAGPVSRPAATDRPGQGGRRWRRRNSTYAAIAREEEERQRQRILQFGDPSDQFRPRGDGGRKAGLPQIQSPVDRPRRREQPPSRRALSRCRATSFGRPADGDFAKDATAATGRSR